MSLPPTTSTKPPNCITSPPRTMPRHCANPNPTWWRVGGRTRMEETVSKGNRGLGRICRTTRQCASHTSPRFWSFSSTGSVHLARRLFFGESSPPSCEINNEVVCIPHAASFFYLFLHSQWFPPHSEIHDEAACILHASSLLPFVHYRWFSPPSRGKNNTRWRASHTPPQFLFFFHQ